MDKGNVVIWSVAIFCAAAVVISPVACTMRQKELIADSRMLRILRLHFARNLDGW